MPGYFWSAQFHGDESKIRLVFDVLSKITAKQGPHWTARKRKTWWTFPPPRPVPNMEVLVFPNTSENWLCSDGSPYLGFAVSRVLFLFQTLGWFGDLSRGISCDFQSLFPVCIVLEVMQCRGRQLVGIAVETTVSKVSFCGLHLLIWAFWGSLTLNVPYHKHQNVQSCLSSFKQLI